MLLSRWFQKGKKPILGVGSADGPWGEIGVPYTPRFKKELDVVAAALGPDVRVRFDGDRPAEIFDRWEVFARVTMYGNGSAPSYEAVVVSRRQLSTVTRELFTKALPTLMVRFEVQS